MYVFNKKNKLMACHINNIHALQLKIHLQEFHRQNQTIPRPTTRGFRLLHWLYIQKQ